ncbi:hypothetical protein METBIDRAFT_77732 [Metschnikowia bicuspidata var. bicuspidata NRRL YB-4993]|uniref:Cysteine protease n=1 Tax=Metschnikowia bicuspidata var. bicuspidata NRRL YB-4993 TaxID=869754 RepID=A0A1A0HEF4_9ASCO|nr:hypothetical protein METBIDRAFT_77732 [Metschnikowia bicuspidata var. bicuspidata NRRL YB-4993]OBA22282.1 hypothetical protein METBIDRAFT_77732 [Metschnikowia bicuspidata var. bicuspidata NRRL YB-4993]
MSSGPTLPTENSVSALEAQILQLQTSFNQLWQKLKTPETPTPARIVIWGTQYGGSTLGCEPFTAAIQSRIWFTYRSGFEPILRAEDGPGPLSFLGSMLFNAIPNTTVAGVLDSNHFTTDVGWGCMIRTSQSLLANTLQSVALGRDYCYKGTDSRLDAILSLFADNYNSPFSLHNFVRAASELPLQVKPGQWFGPSAASLSIKRLCDRCMPGAVPKIHVMISESCDLYDSEIEAHFARDRSVLLVLFPVRLGIENVNAYYHQSLFQLLASKHSVGIAGGKPSSSYYFFGYQDSELLYLDPHNLQAVSRDGSTYHTSKCRSLPISALDPSMLIGLSFLPELEGELVDDFVNVSDHFSDTDSGLVDVQRAAEGPETESSVDASISKYDLVGHTDAA